MKGKEKNIKMEKPIENGQCIFSIYFGFLGISLLFYNFVLSSPSTNSVVKNPPNLVQTRDSIRAKERPVQ